jgi:Ca-activated chloride channel homolog
MNTMRNLAALVLLAAAACAATVSTAAAMSLPGRHTIALDGRLNCPVVSERGGRAYLQLAVEVPAIGTRERRSLNLCVVVDRSGSMGDQGKIQNARSALRALIGQLREGDIFSLVIYDDVVDVLRGSAPVRDRDDLLRLVDAITPRGFTNLGGGMTEGFHQVSRYAGRSTINRVILLSDGLANRGLTDPGSLARTACSEREGGVSLSTIGMGLDYNENLMMALAGQGGGNYYFIERSSDLAAILRNEFDGMGCVVAQNAVVSLDIARGVCVKDVVGGNYTLDGGRLKIAAGDLSAGERREWTVELDIPAGEGSRTVATGSLTFDAVDNVRLHASSFSTSVRYTHDVAEVDRSRDMKVQARADVAVSTRGVERAMKAMDEGKGEVAAAELTAAASALAASPAMNQPGAGNELTSQVSRLRQYEKEMGDKSKDARAVKKSIQFDNYRAQRQK